MDWERKETRLSLMSKCSTLRKTVLRMIRMVMKWGNHQMEIIRKHRWYRYLREEEGNEDEGGGRRRRRRKKKKKGKEGGEGQKEGEDNVGEKERKTEGGGEDVVDG